MSGISGRAGSKSGVLGRSRDTAKAWCNFNGTGTVAINNSFNCSSLTDGGSGSYQVHYITPMSNINYTMVGTVGDWDVLVTSATPNAAYAIVYVLNNNTNSQLDKNHIMIQVFGD